MGAGMVSYSAGRSHRLHGNGPWVRCTAQPGNCVYGEHRTFVSALAARQASFIDEMRDAGVPAGPDVEDRARRGEEIPDWDSVQESLSERYSAMRESEPGTHGLRKDAPAMPDGADGEEAATMAAGDRPVVPSGAPRPAGRGTFARAAGASAVAGMLCATFAGGGLAMPADASVAPGDDEPATHSDVAKYAHGAHAAEDRHEDALPDLDDDMTMDEQRLRDGTFVAHSRSEIQYMLDGIGTYDGKVSDYKREIYMGGTKWKYRGHDYRGAALERQGGGRDGMTSEDPYTGGLIEANNSQEVQDKWQIDHVVPLKYASDHGGYRWGLDKKRSFAHDLDNLVATGPTPNKEKRDLGPSGWMPLINQYEYVSNFVHICYKYNVSISDEDRDAVVRIMDSQCPAHLDDGDWDGTSIPGNIPAKYDNAKTKRQYAAKRRQQARAAAATRRERKTAAAADGTEA